MAPRWIRVAALLLGASVAWEQGCADSTGKGGDDDEEQPTGSGGATASSSSSSSASSSSSSSSSSGSGGGPDTCGNGMLDEGEQCEGTDFGGKDCTDFGLSGGELVCNSFCGIVVSGCTPLENCLNGLDDDEDTLIDCEDDECASLAACTDSCSVAQIAILPFFSDFDTLVGKANSQSNSCSESGNDGPEVVYEVTSNFDGELGISVQGENDITVSVRPSCGGAETRCRDKVGGGYQYENAGLSVTNGQVLYVVVEAASAAVTGDFSIQITQATAETGCADLFDSDYDGALDCDDPTSCQAQAACLPGTEAPGTECAANTECAATTANDPICLPASFGYTGGYCSEFCNLAADDCPGDSVCADLGYSERGVCLDGCTADGECRSGYKCRDLGLSGLVCLFPAEADPFCGDYDDNDYDDLTDCEDPDDCQAVATCTPGAGAVGSACTAHNQCASNAGNDPHCIPSGAPSFWDGSYCTEFCTLGADDCPAGSTCGNYFSWPSGAGNCFKHCTTVADCPTLNYFCGDYFGTGQNVCIY